MAAASPLPPAQEDHADCEQTTIIITYISPHPLAMRAVVREIVICYNDNVRLQIRTYVYVLVMLVHLYYAYIYCYTIAPSHSQSIFLVVMFVEAITVLVRRESHVRITRALRPVFFIDNYLMGGVRRSDHTHLEIT